MRRPCIDITITEYVYMVCHYKIIIHSFNGIESRNMLFILENRNSIEHKSTNTLCYIYQPKRYS